MWKNGLNKHVMVSCNVFATWEIFISIYSYTQARILHIILHRYLNTKI